MRVGFRVSRGGFPVEGAQLRGTLTTGFPFLPAMPKTNSHGEWFGVVPLAVLPGSYAMLVDISEAGDLVRISGLFDEIESLFHVNLGSKTWTREKLPTRIPGDGYFAIDSKLLDPTEVVTLTGDQVLDISSCAQCLYYAPPASPKGGCLVNGNDSSPIPINKPREMTCRLYYPFFLHPVSPQRAARDLARGIPPLPGGIEPLQITAIRTKVHVLVSAWGTRPSAELQWFVLRSTDNGQGTRSVTYSLAYPGKGFEGDFEGFAEIYNPSGTTVESANEFILEYTRLAWAAQTLIADSRSWQLPQVSADEAIAPSYLTVRIPR